MWTEVDNGYDGYYRFMGNDQEEFHISRDWSVPILCHFDLNYQNETGMAINGPEIVVTSQKGHQFTWFSSGMTTTLSASPKPSAQVIFNGGDTSSDFSKSLSGGAIAGIVVGSLVGTIALIGLVFMLLRRHHKMKRVVYDVPPQEGEEGKPQGVAVAPSYQGAPDFQMLNSASSAKYRHEAPLLSPQELPSTTGPHELLGSIATPQSPAERHDGGE